MQHDDQDSATADEPPLDPRSGAPSAETSADAAVEPAPEMPPSKRPRSRAEVAFVVMSSLMVAAYVLRVMYQRFQNAFEPFTAEGDAKQTVWQFYRYYDEGVLPLGHLMTDYAWVYNAPPLYRLIMIPASTFFDPITVANVLTVILYAGALAAMYWVCRHLVNHTCGLAAVMLFVRTPSWHQALAGGHARSFGVPLVLLFVGAWVSGRRRLCLVLLIIQAGIYPPPAFACSLAFGTWSLWRFYKTRDWRPIVELAITAVVVLVLAKSQDLLSPDWWGSPVWYSDVLHHPAFQHGSRMEFVPHESPIFNPAWRYITALYSPDGWNWIDGLSQWDRAHGFVLVLTPAIAALAAALVLRVRFPKRILWLFVWGFLAYIVAREMAFKFHVPTRPIREVWTPLFPLMVSVGTFMAAARFWPKRRVIPAVVAFLLVVGPAFIVHRNGIGIKGPYGNNKHDAPLFNWVRKHTPKDAVFSGTYRGMDLIGLFGWRIPYVNWAQAHPFRPGYWKEIERRTLRMYEATFAVDVDTVLKFAEEEHIDFILVDDRHKLRFKETNSQVMPFAPLRAPVQQMWKRCHETRCVLLDDAIKAAVVKVHSPWRVIDVKKLRDIAAGIPAWTGIVPPTLAPRPPMEITLPALERRPERDRRLRKHTAP